MKSEALVTIGVDTHADFHVGVALDHRGGLLKELTLANDEGGYRRLLSWARDLGELACVGIEGSGSYGAGLSRFLRSEDVRVIEVNRVSRQHRRRRGKYDAADAEAAARAVLSGEATSEPKAADGHVEMLRALKIARSSAIATAMISYAEARATFARLLREERLTAREHSEVVEQLDMRWSSYERPPVTNELVGAAGELAERFALRGYDAVQLASAAACHARRGGNDLPRAVRFMAFDGDLNEAASKVLPLYAPTHKFLALSRSW